MLTADVDDLVGTANDDTFTANLTVASTQTLNSFDTIDGGEGTDSLSATLINTGAGLSPTIENVEVLNLRSIETGGATASLANAEGVEQVWTNGSQTNLTVNNVSELATLGARNIAQSAGHTYNVVYNAGTVAAANTQALALENANLTLDIDQAGANLNTVRNVSVAAAGENVATFASTGIDGLLDNAAIQNLTITGEGDLEVAAGGSAGITAGTVDASEATGNVELTVTDTAAGNLATGVSARSVTLGAGDDVLTALGNISVGSFEGGEGNDTINVDGISGTLVNDLIANVSGFEVLGLNGLNQSVSAATLANVGFDSLVVTDANVGTVTNLTADTELTLVDASAGQDTITLAVTGAATNNDASFGFTASGRDAANADYAVSIADVENIAVTTVDADADVFQATKLAITSAELKNLTISGDEAVVFDGSANAALESVDVSGVTAADAGANDLTVNVTVGNGVTVTGSAGDDSITFGESGEITGGAGEDLFVAGSVTATAAGVPRFSSITDLTADQDDSIEFGAGGTVLSTATGGTDVNQIAEADLGLAPGATATFADYLNMASDQTVGTLSGFEFAGNTYLVEDNTATVAGPPVAGNTFDASADFIVELTGSVDLTEFTYA
ncbi:hypothetical protein [Halovibrio sp. HP20-50]|uniref:beta strand repeat-containing protein n=1 Tax=Halovibrio sp. HP20-59 TaxID=3080275 RepID=UPI00294B9A1B|nr:hypothetical protein [Halovibrio sp. HP20-59]MEA2120092.1 hypothetical protein [Halovibrio sp. HP20-59]